MITSFTTNSLFKAVAHLSNTAMMQRNNQSIAFATDKPTLLVGPNGNGKSSVLQALALHTMSWYGGISSLDSTYSRGHDSDKFWNTTSSWDARATTFLQGLDVEGQNGPALYYESRMIPGRRKMVAEAMMCGYMDEARAYARATEKKSSGQQNQAILDRIFAVLQGKEQAPAEFQTMNWNGSTDPVNTKDVRHDDLYGHRSNQLRTRAFNAKNGIPLILLDEPEQSLDARTQLQFWKMVREADTSKMQIVIATHSVYPMLHREAFHWVEGEEGYVDSVIALDQQMR